MVFRFSTFIVHDFYVVTSGQNERDISSIKYLLKKRQKLHFRFFPTRVKEINQKFHGNYCQNKNHKDDNETKFNTYRSDISLISPS